MASCELGEPASEDHKQDTKPLLARRQATRHESRQEPQIEGLNVIRNRNLGSSAE